MLMLDVDRSGSLGNERINDDRCGLQLNLFRGGRLHKQNDLFYGLYSVLSQSLLQNLRVATVAAVIVAFFHTDLFKMFSVFW